MPRVTTHTASNRGKTYTCTGCGQPIEAGQGYYRWVRRIGPKAGYRRHVSCGYPRPTELSSRKTAQVEEAVSDATTPEVDYAVLDGVDEDNPPETVELDTTPLEDWVSEVADVAEQVADEYEEGVSNMPDSLQYSPTAEAMTQVAEELREWAKTLRDTASESVDVDLPSREDAEEANATWRELANEAIEQAWSDRVGEVDSAMGDMPEYQG